MALPPKMSRCCAGGIPSFSSSLALIWFVCESARPTRCDELAPNVPARVDRLRLLARAGRACASHATNRAPACYSAGHKPSLIDFLYQLTRSSTPSWSTLVRVVNRSSGPEGGGGRATYGESWLNVELNLRTRLVSSACVAPGSWLGERTSLPVSVCAQMTSQHASRGWNRKAGRTLILISIVNGWGSAREWGARGAGAWQELRMDRARCQSRRRGRVTVLSPRPRLKSTRTPSCTSSSDASMCSVRPERNIALWEVQEPVLLRTSCAARVRRTR